MMGPNVRIVNAAIGRHYVAGQQRLMRSLAETGYNEGLTLHSTYPVRGYDERNRYTIKAACMEFAMGGGDYPDVLIWMDCTVVAIKSLRPLIGSILRNGYYLSSSGYAASQTCTDAQLAAIGISRDTAEGIPDTATGCLGIHTGSPRAMEFLNEWILWAKTGLFTGKRTHSILDSTDPRFLFGRQDQSAATLLASKHSMRLDTMNELTAYWPATNPVTCIAYKGIE